MRGKNFSPIRTIYDVLNAVRLSELPRLNISGGDGVMQIEVWYYVVEEDSIQGQYVRESNEFFNNVKSFKFMDDFIVIYLENKEVIHFNKKFVIKFRVVY